MIFSTSTSISHDTFPSNSGFKLSWFHDKEGKKYKIFFHDFSGYVTWDQWLKNDLLKRQMFDNIEPELRRLDAQKGVYHTIDSISDIRNIQLDMMKILSHLSDIANEATFTHPRSGRVIIVGAKERTRYKSFSTSMMITAYDIFTKAFYPQGKKIVHTRSIEGAFDLIVQTNPLFEGLQY